MGNYLVVNKGKNCNICYEGVVYQRWAIKTPLVTKQDCLLDVVKKFAEPVLESDDILFLSEKMVACTQDRAILLSEIKPRLLAKVLSKFVTKSPYGIGLGMAETMEMALKECGTAKILFATLCGMIGKLLGQRGWFYRIAGDKAASIDGPCSYTLPPLDKCVVLGPNEPNEAAEKIAKELNCGGVIIVDINDLGGKILGSSHSIPERDMYVNILKDNPLGQASQQTPMGVIRRSA